MGPGLVTSSLVGSRRDLGGPATRQKAALPAGLPRTEGRDHGDKSLQPQPRGRPTEQVTSFPVVISVCLSTWPGLNAGASALHSPSPPRLCSIWSPLPLDRATSFPGFCSHHAQLNPPSLSAYPQNMPEHRCTSLLCSKPRAASPPQACNAGSLLLDLRTGSSCSSRPPEAAYPETASSRAEPDSFLE